MSTTTTNYEKVILNLNSPYGDVIKEISATPPRPSTTGEIPMIDLAGLQPDNDTALSLIAANIKSAATISGVFYIKNHGVSAPIIEKARAKSLQFFRQDPKEKWKVERRKFHHHNGWTAPGNAKANAAEGIDVKEQFRWHYNPSHDPMYDRLPHPIPLSSLPDKVQPYIWSDDRIWDKTQNVEGFQQAVLEYWKECLILARTLTKCFALALGVEKDEFDSLVTYPCADIALNYYPSTPPSSTPSSSTATQQYGLGSHTDLQCFTILYQDHIGGLLVLNKDNEWIEAKPIKDTLVVNIGDFLSRLTNGKWESTVHRVEINRSGEERISMPLFFGFNLNEKCAVLSTCLEKGEMAKFEPLSCGEWTELKLKRSYASYCTGKQFTNTLIYEGTNHSARALILGQKQFIRYNLEGIPLGILALVDSTTWGLFSSTDSGYCSFFGT